MIVEGHQNIVALLEHLRDVFMSYALDKKRKGRLDMWPINDISNAQIHVQELKKPASPRIPKNKLEFHRSYNSFAGRE